MDVVYLVGGKYWDVETGRWVTTPDQAKEVIARTNDGKPADEAFLLKTLQLYKFPLGELAPEETQESLEQRLTALEEELATVKAQLESFQSSNAVNGGISYGV